MDVLSSEERVTILEEIKQSPYFFSAFENDDECLQCNKKAYGVLFTWYDAEDDLTGYMGFYCEDHLIESYLEHE